MSEVPVRCFTCGSVTGNKYERYIALLTEGKTQAQALEALGLRRPCCRTVILGHIPIPVRVPTVR